MSGPMFKPATRQAVKLKLAVQGPSGSGKTLGALALAEGLAAGGKLAVIDTENGSAALYADRYAFDTVVMHAPYTSAKYQAAIDAAAQAGYAVVVVDSISHQWAGDGGILSRKEADDQRPGSNSYTNWARYTKEHEAFKAFLLNAPIQREGMEYEFAVVFELQMDHKASVSKDRTGLFDGTLSDLTNGEVPKSLTAWLTSAAPGEPEKAPA